MSTSTSVLVGPRMTPDPRVLAKAMLLGEKVHIVAPSVQEALGETGMGFEKYFVAHHLDELDETKRLEIIHDCLRFADHVYRESPAARGWISAEKAGVMTQDLLDAFDGSLAKTKVHNRDMDVIEIGQGQVDLLMYQASHALAHRHGLTALVDKSYVRSLMPSGFKRKPTHGDDDQLAAVVYQMSTAKFHKGDPTMAQVARMRESNEDAFSAFFEADAALRLVGTAETAEGRESALSQREEALKELISGTRLLQRARRYVVDATAPVVTAVKRGEYTAIPIAASVGLEVAGHVEDTESVITGDMSNELKLAMALGVGWIGYRSYVGAKVRTVLESFALDATA